MKNTKSNRGGCTTTAVALTAVIATSISPTSSSPVRADDEVTVGVLVPLTGELGEFGQIVADSIELGVKQVNEAGGTSCGPLRTVVSDTGGSAETGIREASRMIDSEGAVAILGPTSGVMVALVDLAKRKRTVAMSPYAGNHHPERARRRLRLPHRVLRSRRRRRLGAVVVGEGVSEDRLPRAERGVDDLPRAGGASTRDRCGGGDQRLHRLQPGPALLPGGADLRAGQRPGRDLPCRRSGVGGHRHQGGDRGRICRRVALHGRSRGAGDIRCRRRRTPERTGLRRVRRLGFVPARVRGVRGAPHERNGRGTRPLRGELVRHGQPGGPVARGR